jgi:anti-anti-sigma factor
VPLTADVVRDFQTGITDVRAKGTLDVAGAALVRRTVLKCVADSPIAIVLDLGGLTDMSDSGLTVLPMLERRLATDDPPVPLLGHAPVGAVVRKAGRFAVHLDTALPRRRLRRSVPRPSGPGAGADLARGGPPVRGRDLRAVAAAPPVRRGPGHRR